MEEVLSNLGIKELCNGLTLDIIKEKYSWLLNKENKFKDAVIGIKGYDKLICWYSGTWINGTWVDGTWENGTWKKGTWKE
jgi:hypothetical protein